MTTRFMRLMFVLGLVVLCRAVVEAQSAPGTLSGTVTDTSGGVVQRASVDITDEGGRRTATTTDSVGKYVITLPPGRYAVRIRSAGFAEHRRDVVIRTAETVVADVTLDVGAFAERTSASAETAVARSQVSLAPEALPASVTVLRHADLERTNIAQDIGTIFRRVPGVLAHNINQGETGTAIKLRGFSSSTHGADTAAYVDGIAQNLPSAAINHGMNDMSWLTPDMIERVEVVKGPFSALYGDQNRAGAVNIITRSAAASSVAGTFGSFGNKRLSAVFSRPIAGAQVLVVGDLFDIDGYRTNDRDTRGTVFGKVSTTRGRSNWSLRGGYYKADWDAPGFLNVSSVTAGTVNRIDRDPTAPRLWGKGDRTSLVFTRTPAAGESGLHVSAAAEDYSRTRALGANTTDYNVQMDDRWMLQARVVENIAVGTKAAFAVGSELRRDRGDSINQRWPGGSPGANYSWNQDLTLLTYGVFAQTQVKPMTMLKLIGGARYDRFDYDLGNRKLPAASVNYKRGVLSPRAGLVVSAVKAVEFFANVGEGFRSPNQTEISPSGALGPLGAAGGMPFPDLAVPKIRSYDFGATISVAGRLSLTAAGYHTFNQNEILQVSPGVFDAVGDTVRNGWELESQLTLPRATTVYASLSEITDARLENPPANTANAFLVPKHMIKGGIAHTLPAGGGQLLLNADAYYMSGIPYYTGAPLQLRGVSRPYSRYDLRGTFERGAVQYTLYGTIQPNLYSSEPISVTSAGVFYDPRPRSEMGVTLRYRFRQR